VWAVMTGKVLIFGFRDFKPVKILPMKRFRWTLVVQMHSQNLEVTKAKRGKHLLVETLSGSDQSRERENIY